MPKPPSISKHQENRLIVFIEAVFLMLTQAQAIGNFSSTTGLNDIPELVRNRLKIHILDTLGCAIAALGAQTIEVCRQQVADFGGNGRCTLIGGGKTCPPYAAFFNTALTRYLDLSDNFLVKGEVCHPSDNFGAILAAAEDAEVGGDKFLSALAVAYEVQGRLTEKAKFMQFGFDHTSQLSISIPAGIANIWQMNMSQAASAIGASVTNHLSLAHNQGEPSSNWKGLASSQIAFGCTHIANLARMGITGPVSIFEGPKGLEHAIRGKLRVNWSNKSFDIVPQCGIKRYCAEVNAQSAIACIIAIKEAHAPEIESIERIEVETFQAAFNLIGGGSYGHRKDVSTRESADHSLPYLLAVALLDGDVYPEQFSDERIKRADVQALLKKVLVRTSTAFSRSYPVKMESKVTITMKDHTKLSMQENCYPGFHATPLDWNDGVAKFKRLAAYRVGSNRAEEIVEMVKNLEQHQIADLTALLHNC